MWIERLTVVSFTLYFLQLCGGEEVLNCSVTTDASVVKYVIQDEAHKLDPSCKFSWNNASNHVLSTHKQPSGEGWNSSINTFNTSRCLEHITFKGHCQRSGYATDYRASCSTNCTVQAPIHGDTDGLSFSLTVAVVAVVLVVGLISALIWKILQKKGCTPKDRLQAVYIRVRKKDDHPQPSDVEAGHG